MCGRFTMTTPAEVIAELFELEELPQLLPRYNIAPTQQVPVVRFDADRSKNRLSMLRWGLIPHWATDPSIGHRMINARAETVAQKPSFRSPIKRRRCLVVADGFYEWKKMAGGKQPYLIRMNDGSPFAFAGLWDRWVAPDDCEIDTCTIVTTQPNSVCQEIHDRMPVILPPEAYSIWLDPDIQNVDGVSSLLTSYQSTAMEFLPVSTHVNKPSNDDPACVQEITIQR